MISQSEARAVSQESCDIHCELISVRVSMVYMVALVLFHEKISEEWSKYMKNLDREDKEFRKAIEEEVTMLLYSTFSNKYRILAGIDTITQNQIDLPIFKQCLALFP